MAITFPTGLDALTNPTSGDNLDTAGVLHDVQHSDLNDAVEALQAKVGINSSAVTTTLDYRVAQALLRDFLSQMGNSEVSITGATTLNSTAFGKLHVCSGTSANYTADLPAASGNAGKIIGFRMSGVLTKLVTLDGNSSEVIDGAPTRAMWANETAFLLCDGTGWIKIFGRSIPMYCRMARLTGVTVPASTVYTVAMDTTQEDNSGMMAALGTGDIRPARAGIYMLAASVQFSNVPAAPSLEVWLVVNGVTKSKAGAASSTNNYNCYQTVVPAIALAAGASGKVEFGGYQSSGGAATLFTFDDVCWISAVEICMW